MTTPHVLCQPDPCGVSRVQWPERNPVTVGAAPRQSTIAPGGSEGGCLPAVQAPGPQTEGPGRPRGVAPTAMCLLSEHT